MLPPLSERPHSLPCATREEPKLAWPCPQGPYRAEVRSHPPCLSHALLTPKHGSKVKISTERTPTKTREAPFPHGHQPDRAMPGTLRKDTGWTYEEAQRNILATPTFATQPKPQSQLQPPRFAEQLKTLSGQLQSSHVENHVIKRITLPPPPNPWPTQDLSMRSPVKPSLTSKVQTDGHFPQRPLGYHTK